jgi:hypothetical protein
MPVPGMSDLGTCNKRQQCAFGRLWGAEVRVDVQGVLQVLLCLVQLAYGVVRRELGPRWARWCGPVAHSSMDDDRPRCQGCLQKGRGSACFRIHQPIAVAVSSSCTVVTTARVMLLRRCLSLNPLRSFE